MPTGYTAGILNGTITTFEEYAKGCSRAFVLHMRDEPSDAEFKPREPGDYHLKAVEKAKVVLEFVNTHSDEELLEDEKKKLEGLKVYHEKEIKKALAGELKMREFLERAREYTPPTDSHKAIAEFMQNQIEITLDGDYSGGCHKDCLEKVEADLESMSANNIRNERRLEAYGDVERHTRHHKEEVKRCKEHNGWYYEFVDSLK